MIHMRSRIEVISVLEARLGVVAIADLRVHRSIANALPSAGVVEEQPRCWRMGEHLRIEFRTDKLLIC